MRNIHFVILTLAALLSIGSSALYGADAKALADLKAAGASAGPLKEGGVYVNIPGPKLTEDLWKQIEALGDLKSFSGSGKEFDDAALARLAKITTIESLFFNGPGITDQGLSVLATFPNLHKYGTDHGGPKLTGTGVAALTGAKSLQAISFGGCLFGDSAMEALGTLTQLREVSLNHDRLTSKGFANFAKLTELQKLRFNPNNSPYYTGADFIHLSGLANLQDLTIGQMVLPYENGLAHLKSLHQLKTLKLTACAITDADLARLKADLPNTAIEFTPAKPEVVKNWNALAKKKG